MVQNFVILSYERSYTTESSCVGLFDDKGKFVAFYELLENRLYYEEYAGSQTMGGEEEMGMYGLGHRFSNPVVKIATTGGFGQDRWGLEPVFCLPPELMDNDQLFFPMSFTEDTILGYYSLYNQYDGVLSHAESMCILMHALSSDARAIYTVVDCVASNWEAWIPFYQGSSANWHPSAARRAGGVV